MNGRRNPVAALIGLVASAALLTACGGGGSTVPGDDLPAMRAVDQAAPPVEPVRFQPRDTRVVSGDGFTLRAPSVFQRRDPSAGGRSKFVLERPSTSAALPARVVVLRESHPKNDVVEQAYAAEVTMRTTKGITDVLRSDVAWPGARRAVLLQWTQDVAARKAAAGSATKARFWQLNLQVKDDLILVAVAVAPVDDFESSGVGDVLRTFQPSD